MNTVVVPDKKSKTPKTPKMPKVAAAATQVPAPVPAALPAQPNPGYLIQARWKHASFIRQVIESIKDLVRETNMDWDSAGIRIQGMDPAHVALSNIFLSSEDCECYHIREGITVGIDLHSVNKILAMTDSTDSCEFFIKSDEDSNLSIKIQSQDNSKEGLFEIPLLEIESEFMEIPETDYENQVQIASSEVPSAIRDMSFLSDSVDFNISHDEFQLKVQGDCGKGQRSWKDTICKITTNCDKNSPHSQRFPIKYIMLALKATATTQTLLLEFSPNSPLRIRCMIGAKSSIVNFVAPKIDEDD